MAPPPIPPKFLAAMAVALFLLSGCQPGQNGRAVPSVAQIGGDLNCVNGDHGFEDLQAGWGFCYPADWRYIERSQGSVSPPGLDLTFDITNVPPTPVACVSPDANGAQPPCSGQFGFMIISTYERGNAQDLAGWIQANLTPPSPSPTAPAASPSPSPALTLQPIRWGNAVEAGQLSDGRRIALTQHHVVVMVLHSGGGYLDLETQMSTRLPTWKFAY